MPIAVCESYMNIQRLFFILHSSLILFFSWLKSKCFIPILACLHLFVLFSAATAVINKNILPPRNELC